MAEMTPERVAAIEHELCRWEPDDALTSVRADMRALCAALRAAWERERVLRAALSHYANGDNWELGHPAGVVWIAECNAPDLACVALGVDEDTYLTNETVGQYGGKPSPFTLAATPAPSPTPLNMEQM